MRFQTANGRIIELSPNKRIGCGGEGEVLPVVGAPGLVGKILHHPTRERQAKVQYMVANAIPINGTTWVAWPSDMLFTTTGVRTRFAGFVMPKITRGRPLFVYYNPAERRQNCPGFDYHYLVRTAHNLAAAVTLAHQHGHVIGDLNESNALVTNDGIVGLLDVDSWQISDSTTGVVYLCGVGKGEFLPPELQGKNLSRLNRLPCHDNFALAVLIFKLLNEGAHPCDGVFLGRGEPPPVEARITAGDFPYRDRSGHWAPKPLAVPFASLHPKLQQLFIKTFETGHSRPQMRPDASTWQEAIARAEKDFRVCTVNPHHWCWTSHCIWCERAALLGGVDPFPIQRPARHRQNPRPVAVPQQAAPPAVNAQPAPAWRPVWLPSPIAEIIESIAQKFSIHPEVAATLCGGAAILVLVAAITKLLHLTR